MDPETFAGALRSLGRAVAMTRRTTQAHDAQGTRATVLEHSLLQSVGALWAQALRGAGGQDAGGAVPDALLESLARVAWEAQRGAAVGRVPGAEEVRAIFREGLEGADEAVLEALVGVGLQFARGALDARGAELLASGAEKQASGEDAASGEEAAGRAGVEGEEAGEDRASLGQESFRRLLVARYWEGQLRRIAEASDAGAREAITGTLLGARLLGEGGEAFGFLQEMLGSARWSKEAQARLVAWGAACFNDEAKVHAGAKVPAWVDPRRGPLREAALAIASTLSAGAGVRAATSSSLRSLLEALRSAGERVRVVAPSLRASRAALEGVDLGGAILAGADLNRAQLAKANLDGANFAGADLRGADLSGASLRDTNLSGANLAGARLDAAFLFRTNLAGTNFEVASSEGMVCAQVLDDAATRWPPALPEPWRRGAPPDAAAEILTPPKTPSPSENAEEVLC